MEELIEKHPLPWYRGWESGCYGGSYVEDANGERFHLENYEDEIVDFFNNCYNTKMEETKNEDE